MNKTSLILHTPYYSLLENSQGARWCEQEGPVVARGALSAIPFAVVVAFVEDVTVQVHVCLAAAACGLLFL